MKIEPIKFGGGGQDFPPTVTVFIALYNGKKYIENAINSVLEQTFKDFEILIIDDCSTDGSLDFIREKYSDARIRLFRHENNCGVAQSLNDSIQIAHGKYLYFMAQDDAIIPIALEKLYEIAEKYQSDVLHTTKYFDAVDPDFSLKDGLKATITSEVDPILGLQPLDFNRRIAGIGQRTFYPEFLNFCRVELLREKKIFEPDVRLASDVFFTLALLFLVEKFVKIDLPVYIYRRGSANSITNSSLESHFRSFICDLPKMLSFTRQLYAREDSLIKLSNLDQISLTSSLISVIFQNSIFSTDPNFATSEVAEKVLREVLSQPKFYSEEFVRDVLRIFCKPLGR